MKTISNNVFKEASALDIAKTALMHADEDLISKYKEDKVEKTLSQVIDDSKLVKEGSETKMKAQIWKANEEQQIVYGVVIEPWTDVTKDGDSHGDRMTKEEIEKSAHNYMYEFQEIKEQHEKAVEARPVESFIAPVDFKAPDGQIIKEGSWIMAVKIDNDDTWEKIKKGEITAFSPGGFGKRRPL